MSDIINNIYVDGNLIIGYTISGKYKLYHIKNNESIQAKYLECKKIEIECVDCKKIFKRGFVNILLIKKYLCHSCSIKGERNGFYGKKHTIDFKRKLSEDRKGTWYVGSDNANFGKTIKDFWVEKYGEEEANKKQLELNKIRSIIQTGKKNSFYGKTHSKETIDIINIKKKETINNWTESQRDEYSKKLSLSQKQMMVDDPIGYSKKKAKAGRASFISQCESWNMNSVESLLKQELDRRNLDFKFSIIFCHKQFDFGNKKHKILIEVQGDYWHGNPMLFNEDGSDGKRILNNIQKEKIENDILKNNIALKYGFKIFYIWETDIHNKNFEILDEIEILINSV